MKLLTVSLALLGTVAAASCGGGGIDPNELAEAVRTEAQKDFELVDDFQQVDDCVSIQGEALYECRVIGHDGEQFIDVQVIDGERFRVDEPEINTSFDGDLP